MPSRIIYGLLYSLLLCLWVLPVQAAPQHILMLGDSLTEGYGLEPDLAYPALVETQLRKKGFDINVINAGIGGSTTASALKRLKWHLKARPKPTIMLLALGPNDGMRGLSLKQAKANLSAVIQLAQKHQLTVILAGMKLPPNYGADYTQKFEQMYLELATTYQLMRIPFLLEGVAAKPDFNLPDGIHPNEQGHRIMSQTVLPYLEKALKSR